MSGVGIAEKIQEIMKKTLGDCGLDFVTMEYKKLLDLLNEDESKNFRSDSYDFNNISSS